MRAAGRPDAVLPEEVPELRETVLAYMDAMTRLGHAVVAGIALSLGLDRGYFEEHCTRSPFVLFRIFDVIKPFPARRFEALHGGLGVMADDAMAAIYANLSLRLVMALLPQCVT